MWAVSFGHQISNLQLKRALSQYETTRLRISIFEIFLKSKFSDKLQKIIEDVISRKNYKHLSSDIWRQVILATPETLRVLWQPLLQKWTCQILKISQKLEGFEQSYLLEDSDRASLSRWKLHILLNFYIFKLWKILKKVIYRKYKDLRSHIQRQDSQPLRVPSELPTTRWRSSKFLNIFKS